jgi:serine/threonine protein kinase/DNA-binding XRE family transcriptional regulator
MDASNSFGMWIKRRRKALDLTQDVLARQVGCSKDLIVKIEGDARRPSRQMAERIAMCLLIPAEDQAAFLRAARAELAADRLAPLPVPPPEPLPRPGAAAQVHRPSKQPTRPPTLKGYELREEIGTGGFGTVYRAIQPGVGRDVAVKIIRPEYANHPDFIRRFEAEAQLVARLEHPYIVPLYDFWRDKDGAYLVMRYIRRGSLLDALRRGAWSLDQAARLLEQIGAALAFAHHYNVVHRDLKPANILLDEEGNAYLADFGIAKNLDTATAVGETEAGVVVGSPTYLSPEQLRDEPITLQSDIYSLGVLLYEVLIGTHPFADLPPAERMYQQLHTPLPPLQRTRPNLPSTLNALIQRATAKAPADRYRDVLSLVADWQRSVARDPSPWFVARRQKTNYRHLMLSLRSISQLSRTPTKAYARSARPMRPISSDAKR